MWRDRRLLVLAGAIVGLAAGGLVTLLQDDTFRADAAIVIVRQGQPPGSDPVLARSAEAAAELFNSRAVADSAIANLRLEISPDDLLEPVSIETEPGSSLVRLRVEAGSRNEARQLAQELTEVSTVLFNDRFGPETVASIWEAPQANDERVSPRPVLNGALGLLAGAVATGLALVALRRRGVRSPGSARRRAAGPPWTLVTLERLVAETAMDLHRRRELERLIEALREFSPGGAVPSRLDRLVARSFGEIVSAGSSGAGASPPPRAKVPGREAR